MWNALSPDIKLSRNANAFKQMLKSSLLEDYKFDSLLKFMLNLFFIIIYFISLKRYNLNWLL